MILICNKDTINNMKNFNKENTPDYGIAYKMVIILRITLSQVFP